MASYGQWAKKIAKKPEHVDRLTWVCGAEKALVNEVAHGVIRRVLAAAKEAGNQGDSYMFTAGVDPEGEIWECLYQYPFDADSMKLVVIHQAHELRNIERFTHWVETCYRDMPTVRVLLVSGESDIDTKKGRTAAAQELCKNKGSIVRCAPLTLDQSAAWLRDATSLTAPVAEFVAGRCSGNMGLILDFAYKANLFPAQHLNQDAAAVLLIEDLGESFTELLIKGRKRDAIEVAQDLDDSAVHSVLMHLSSRLRFMERLYSMRSRNADLHEMFVLMGKQGFMVADSLPFVVGYTPERVRQRRIALGMTSTDAGTQALVHLVSIW